MANLRKTLFAFCSSFLLATNMLMADTIRFKNGAYIEVDNASEKDGQIEYWMGSTRYTIPKTKIEKIVKGGGPSITLGSQAPVNLVPPSSADAASQHSNSIPLPAATASKHAKISVPAPSLPEDRKSTRLNSSHANISYAVFCLKKKKKNK